MAEPDAAASVARPVPVADDLLTAVAAALAALHDGHSYDWQCPVCTKDFATLAQVAASTVLNLPMLTCGCCGLCGAPPGHQHPSTGKPWQHAHTQGASDV